MRRCRRAARRDPARRRRAGCRPPGVTPTAQQQAGVGRRRVGGAGAAHALGRSGDRDVVHDGGVGEHRVDLPRLGVGAVDPHLVLHGVAAGGVLLDIGERGPRPRDGRWRP